MDDLLTYDNVMLGEFYSSFTYHTDHGPLTLKVGRDGNALFVGTGEFNKAVNTYRTSLMHIHEYVFAEINFNQSVESQVIDLFERWIFMNKDVFVKKMENEIKEFDKQRKKHERRTKNRKKNNKNNGNSSYINNSNDIRISHRSS